MRVRMNFTDMKPIKAEIRVDHPLMGLQKYKSDLLVERQRPILRKWVNYKWGTGQAYAYILKP